MLSLRAGRRGSKQEQRSGGGGAGGAVEAGGGAARSYLANLVCDGSDPASKEWSHKAHRTVRCAEVR